MMMLICLFKIFKTIDDCNSNKSFSLTFADIQNFIEEIYKLLFLLTEINIAVINRLMGYLSLNTENARFLENSTLSLSPEQTFHFSFFRDAKPIKCNTFVEFQQVLIHNFSKIMTSHTADVSIPRPRVGYFGVKICRTCWYTIMQSFTIFNK